MKTFTDWQNEMKDWFEKRTHRHIALVKKYAKKIADYDPKRFGKLVEQTKFHDASKFKAPEYEPYVLISWQYKCKDEGKEFEPPKDLQDQMNKATEHHVKNNQHHPEFHSSDDVPMINRQNRDKPPAKMVDATSMPDLDVAEMVADWLAMAEEKGTDAKTWADKNVNIRWKFNDAAAALIYKLLKAVK